MAPHTAVGAVRAPRYPLPGYGSEPPATPCPAPVAKPAAAAQVPLCPPPPTGSALLPLSPLGLLNLELWLILS